MIALIRDPPLDEADLIIEELKKKTKVEVIYRDEIIFPIKIESNIILKWDSVDKRGNKSLIPFLELLEREKRVINSLETIRACNNKALTSYLLEKEGILTPSFYLIEINGNEIEQLIKAGEKLGYPLVVKPFDGSRGIGVRRFFNERELVEEMRGKEGIYIVQKYIEKPNWDVRVCVVDGNYSISYKRISKSWITNVHAGGRREEFFEQEILEIAERVGKIFKGSIIGMDLIRGKEGYYVIEVNHKPGIPTSLPKLAKKFSKDIAEFLIREEKK